MRGRKPKPTQLKLLENNPGRRPLNAREPTAPAIAVKDAPPAEVLRDPLAVAEYRRVLRQLQRGHVTTVDRATLGAYALKYAQWTRLEAEAARQGFIVTTPNGYPIQNPAIAMANKACMLMLRLAVELGITPSSRSRIHVLEDAAAGAPIDPFADFQRRRGTLR